MSQLGERGAAGALFPPPLVRCHYGDPVLVIVTGLPGVGKSALADGLGGRLGIPVLSVDPIESAMRAAGLPEGWTTGVAAYEVAGAVAAHLLGLGQPVIVDAVSDSEPARATWRRAAAAAGARLAVLEVVCSDPSLHRSRLAGRSRQLAHIPEPSWQQVAERAAGYEPWTDERLVLDAVAPLPDLVDTAAAYLVELASASKRRTG